MKNRVLLHYVGLAVSLETNVEKIVFATACCFLPLYAQAEVLDKFSQIQ